jgi:hypothetical protein
MLKPRTLDYDKHRQPACRNRVRPGAHPALQPRGAERRDNCENTLAPGATASVTRTLINGRFDNDTFYTVSLDVLVPGTGGAITYDYSVQVQIGSPPPASS